MWKMETRKSNGIRIWRDKDNTYRRVRHNERNNVLEQACVRTGL